MQEIKYLNDIFLEYGVSESDLTRFLSEAFSISENNIFKEDEDTSRWDDTPYFAYCYSIEKGILRWRIDAGVSADCDVDKSLKALATACAVKVVYDENDNKHPNNKLIIFPDGRIETAIVEINDSEDGYLIKNA